MGPFLPEERAVEPLLPESGFLNGLCLGGHATKLGRVEPFSRSDDGTSEPPDRFRWGGKPSTLSELAERAERLAGLRLGELARECHVAVPSDLKRAKGWVGGLMELALGASAASRAEPDFPELGVELKTLPVDAQGKPLESTFVCTIELGQIADSEWEESRLWSKLGHVLWVVVEGVRKLPVAERRIGTPFFWIPSEEERALIRRDWEQLTLLIAQGRTSEITGHLGEVLQVRPKAARGSSRRRTLDEDGALYDEQPKGFYLRAGFTGSILAGQFHLPR
jgi:DNA mismatch repair protein MutH